MIKLDTSKVEGSTHHCCRVAAACSECRCWSFLPSAPWKERTDRQTNAVKHVGGTDKSSWASRRNVKHSESLLILQLALPWEQR